MEKDLLTKVQSTEQESIAEKNNKFIKEIFNDVIKYSPSKLIGLILNILIVPIYTKLLTPDEYGLYAVSIATLSFICIIFSDWVSNAALRFFKNNQIKNNIPEYFGNLIILLCTNLGFMFILCILCQNKIFEYFHIPSRLLYFILILIIPIAFRALLLQILRAQLKAISYSSSMIVNQILTIFFAIYFIKAFNVAPEGIIVSMTLCVTLIDVILIYQTELLKFISFKRINIKLLFDLCFYGLPLALGQMSIWVMTQSNKFVLQHYKGSFYNGIAGVAYNLTYSILLSLLSVFIMATLPRIITRYENKLDVIGPISKMSGYFIGVSFPLVLFMSVYAQELVNILSNAKYMEAAILIPYLALAAVFMLLTEFTTIQYHLVNKTYIDTCLKLIVGIFGILLNIILIPKIGIIAVGVAALVINVLYFSLSLLITMPNLGWKMPKGQIFISFVSVIITSFIYFILNSINNIVQINNIVEMVIILLSYYSFYYYINKKFIKSYNR